jgi:hypothetical protein
MYSRSAEAAPEQQLETKRGKQRHNIEEEFANYN